MAVGLSPENWALLALCGVCLGLVSSLLAIEPGFLLMPLLAILLPRLGVPSRSRGAGRHRDRARAARSVVDRWASAFASELSADVWRGFRPPFWLAAFFGASLVPLIPGPWLLAGFAVTAVIALLRPPPAITLTLAVTPPRRPAQPFAAILKSAVSSLFGIGLPLSDGAAAEKAALTLMLALAAMAALLNAPPACRGCVGFVFTPALFAIGAAFVLTAPLWRALLGERPSRSRLRPLAVLAAVSALLAAPMTISGTRKTAFAALAPGLCRATAANRFGFQAARYRDPLYLLAQQSGPRRGLAALQAKTPSSSFLAVARDTQAHPPVAQASAWIASIEVRAASAKPRKQTLSTQHAQALTHALNPLRRHGARPARRRSCQCGERTRCLSHGLGGERLARYGPFDPRDDRKDAVR